MSGQSGYVPDVVDSIGVNGEWRDVSERRRSPGPGLVAYRRFKEANLGLTFRKSDRLVSYGAGWETFLDGRRISDRFWDGPRVREIHVGGRMGLDHLVFMYHSGEKRRVLVSMPNLFLDDRRQCPCGCLGRLEEVLERVNRAADRAGRDERLLLHIGANGTSWRGGWESPLVVVASSRVGVLIPDPVPGEYSARRGDWWKSPFGIRMDP